MSVRRWTPGWTGSPRLDFRSGFRCHSIALSRYLPIRGRGFVWLASALNADVDVAALFEGAVSGVRAGCDQ